MNSGPAHDAVLHAEKLFQGLAPVSCPGERAAFGMRPLLFAATACVRMAAATSARRPGAGAVRSLSGGTGPTSRFFGENRGRESMRSPPDPLVLPLVSSLVFHPFAWVSRRPKPPVADRA